MDAFYFFSLSVHCARTSNTIEKLLETHNLPKLNEEEAEILNGPIIVDEIEAVIKKLLAHKNPGPDGLTSKCYKIFREELTLILLKIFKKIQDMGRLPNSFYVASIILIPNQIKTQERKKTTGQYH